MVSFFRFFEVAAALVKVGGGGAVILTKGIFGAIVYTAHVGYGEWLQGAGSITTRMERG